MKYPIPGLTVFVLILAASGASASKGEQWLTDMDRAQQVARDEGKDIFMFYTGSDWCTWCIVLEKEVLSQPEFLQYAAKNLVLVELDFPKDTQLLSKEQKAHNAKWLERFPPAGYPTVLLTDASVNRYAKTGYRAGGVQPYIEHLRALKSVPAELAAIMSQADLAVGIERARLLDRALGIEGAIVDSNALKAQIVRLLTADAEVEKLRVKYIKPVPVIKGDKELQDEMAALLKLDTTPAARVTALGELIARYGYVKDGDAINGAVNSVARIGMASGQQTEAIAIIDRLLLDTGYTPLLRENFGVAKAALLASTGDRAAAVAQVEAVMKLVPEKEGTGLREALMENIEIILAQPAR